MELLTLHKILFIIPGIVILFLMIWLFEWLWNITMPQLFNLKEITYWQAFRLLLIAAMLLGGGRIVS